MATYYRSYMARVEARRGDLLLGGVPSTRSCRYATREQAEAFGAQCVEANANKAPGALTYIVPCEALPEIDGWGNIAQ